MSRRSFLEGQIPGWDRFQKSRQTHFSQRLAGCRLRPGTCSGEVFPDESQLRQACESGAEARERGPESKQKQGELETVGDAVDRCGYTVSGETVPCSARVRARACRLALQHVCVVARVLEMMAPDSHACLSCDLSGKTSPEHVPGLSLQPAGLWEK